MKNAIAGGIAGQERSHRAALSLRPAVGRAGVMDCSRPVGSGANRAMVLDDRQRLGAPAVSGLRRLGCAMPRASLIGTVLADGLSTLAAKSHG